jgi:RNase P subunit RPR2
MASTKSYNRSQDEMACTECNQVLIAPVETRYVCKRAVYHFWSCKNCGHQIDMTVNLRANDKQDESKDFIEEVQRLTGTLV